MQQDRYIFVQTNNMNHMIPIITFNTSVYRVVTMLAWEVSAKDVQKVLRPSCSRQSNKPILCAALEMSPEELGEIGQA